ncbi:MAG: type II toxin-antitoxin system VapC family toxin [Nanoarchaeota archaeon]
MEDTLCIDTDVLVDLLRKKDNTLKWFEENEDNFQLATTTINIFELYYGSYKSTDPDNSIIAVNHLLDNLTILTLDKETAREAAQQLAKLSSEGNIIDFKDMFIGAIALKLGYSLKTNNKKDFEKIRGLKII